MGKYIIDEKTLIGLANAIRKVTGETRTYNATEMIEAVTNIMDSAVYILVDEDGNELPAAYVDSETTLTATPNDIRLGTTAVTNAGMTVGTKEIPAYITTEGQRKISAGLPLDVPIYSDECEFTKFQALVCTFNTSVSDSVATEKVVINGKVYAVLSADALSNVTVDSANQTIKLSLTNDSDKPVVIRYFTYKEVY